MEALKDSKVEWLGQIPESWNVDRTKFHYRNLKQIAGIKSYEYERLALTLNGVIKRPKDDADGLQPGDFNGYQVLRSGDLVFKLIDLQNVSTSRVGLSHNTGIVSPAYIRLEPNKGESSRYGEYYFLSMWQREIFNQLGDAGVRSNLSSSDLLELPYISLPLDEQEKIADFLDEKCAEIDKLSEDIQKQIEILEDYKKTIITRAVTKGLNPSIEMKYSETGWLGSIPSHWNTKRISALYSLRNIKVSDEEFPPLSVTMRGILPQLENVAKTDDHSNRKLVRRGDFVINSRSDRRGSCGISGYDGSVSLINTVLKPNGTMNNEYYNWLFHTPIFADEYYKWGHGIVDDLWTTNWQDMKVINVPVPPISEQMKIAEYLNEICGKIDASVSGKQEQYDKLISYKKSIVYEYVTGKKRVKGAL